MNLIVDYLITHKEGLSLRILTRFEKYRDAVESIPKEFYGIYKDGYKQLVLGAIREELCPLFTSEELLTTIDEDCISLIFGPELFQIK